MDSIEARQARLAAALDYSAALEKRTEEMSVDLPVMTWETPRQIRTQVADRLENEFTTRLLAMEARFSLRLDAIEGRQTELSNSIRAGLECLADVTGSESGLQERRLREEFRKEVESLRGDMTLLRSQASTPARRKPNVSRAPFQLDDENAALRN